jgi:hypothetical protein
MGLTSADLEKKIRQGPLLELRASTISSGPYAIRVTSDYSRHLQLEEREDHSVAVLVVDSKSVLNALRPQCLGISAYNIYYGES